LAECGLHVSVVAAGAEGEARDLRAAFAKGYDFGCCVVRSAQRKSAEASDRAISGCGSGRGGK
jgi:2-methylcitrate dehydratase PrpD